MKPYTIQDQQAPYFLTLQIVAWVDIFSREIYRRIVVNALRYSQDHKGLEVFAWVLMSNHLHLIVRSGAANLSGTLKDFKSFSAKKMIEMIIDGEESRKQWILKIFKEAAQKHKRNSNYQVWTHENHAEQLHTNNFTWQKLEYIHNNPVKAGIVLNTWEYRYSSAPNSAGMEGELPVILLTPRLERF